jgi:hypothetical protein
MPGYVWDGSNWRTMNSIWTWDGSNWRSVSSGWAWTGSTWSQIFSSGTFTPILRISGQTTPATARSAGLAIELYRGSTASGSYAYQFQYAIGTTSSWTNESITGSSGTLTGATTTASFTTDSSYVTSLETIAYSGNNTGILDDIDTYRLQVSKQAYIRARVIKSGETQFTNNVRIQKRQAINTGTLLRLRRASTGITYTLTGNPSTDKQPFVGDTIFWEPSFQSTTTLTNDTRPDYYWFSFDSNSGPNYRNSIISDPTNPRNPINARSYTIQSSDINGPVVCNLRAVNTNGAGTGDITIATRDVSDGTLTAPTNLVLQYSGLNLVGTWDPAGGGNDTTITYTWFLERSVGGGAYTQIASGNTTTQTFSSSQTTAGNYRFRVTAAQTGSPNVTSEYSNVFELKAPAAFNVTIQNVTNTETYRPSLFTVSAPTLSSTVVNRWDWNWTTSTITGPAYAKVGSFNVTSMNNWTSTLTRPGGGTSTTTVSSPTDFWIITSSGFHTETVTANNNRKNYVRISWTKPASTSAVSYRININAYSAATGGSIDWTRVINVEDVTFVDIEHDYAANGAWSNGQTVFVSSVIAYNGAGQTGVSTVGTTPTFNEFGADGTTNWSACNVIGTRQASVTNNLTLESPTASFIYITGTFQPSGVLSVTGTRPSTGTTGWSPLFSDAGWTHTYQWYREGSVTFGTISGATSPTLTIPSSSAYVGDVINVNVASTYKGQSFGSRFDSTSDADSTIYPGAPVSFTVNDNGNRTFSVTNVSALGATHYYGSYSGTFGSGTIGETAIGGTWSSPQGFAGSVTVTLFARTYKTIIYPTNQGSVAFNSKTSAVVQQTISPSPQDTSSRRYLSNAPSVSAGNTLYISTNGYFGNAAMGTNNYFSPIPTPGGFLNIAAQDLVMSYCFTKVDNGGIWIRYRGERYPSGTNRWLEYQAYLTFSGTVYVLFIENSLTDYVASTAYTINGSIQNTWASSSADQSGFTINQGTTGWTQRTATTGTADDGYVAFTVIRPARQHQASAVTRTAGGFTFNITNVDDGLFESAASYGVSTTAGTASINASTGLVTQTGLTSNQFATVTVSKARTGYETATNVERQGQALAGSPPSQTVAPSISASGTADASGTVRRIQVGGTVSGSAGTYNNQQSISSGLLTILSNSYTGSDSDWTSAGSLGTSVLIGTSAASASANMYRWRDRVVGTDGSTVDFYTPVSYRAVYAPPPGGSLNSVTQTSITINYTGGSGAPRYYRFRDGTQIDFINDGGAGPFTTTFSGLSAGTFYTVQLFGGNTEGYLSVGAAGGTYQTASNKLATPTGVNASDNRTDGVLVSWNAVSGASYYGIWWGGPPGYDNAPDFGGPNSNGGWNGFGTSFLDTTISAGSSRDYYVQAYASGNPAGTKSDWGGPNNGTRISAPVGGTPGTPSTPSISYLGSGPFRWSATTSAGINTDSLEWNWEVASNSGGPAASSGTSITGATGTGTWSDSTYSWARVRVRGYNNAAATYGPYSGFSGWA